MPCAVRLEASCGLDRAQPALFPAAWTPAAAGDAPGSLTVANVSGPPAPDVPFHDRLARLLSLREGVVRSDLQEQEIGPLKVMPPAGTYRVAASTQ